MKKILTLLCFAMALLPSVLHAQLYLLYEKANHAKTVKYQIGDQLRFRLEGEEGYWYARSITNILPESNSIMLDNYLVKVSDIVAIKRPPNTFCRITGGALLSFGIGLTFATTAALLYRDEQNYPAYYGAAAASLVSSRFLLRRRTVKLGEKHRLRPIEIRFGPSN
jgi:hypothetical protein